MDLKQWVDTRNIPVDPVIEHQIIWLDQLDEQCTRCALLPVDEMLCSGWRPFFQEEDSDYYGIPTVANGSCYKMVDKQNRNLFNQKLQRSQLTKAVVQESINNYGADTFVFELTEDEVIVNGINFPKFSWVSASIASIQVLQTLVVAAIFNGYDAKRLYPQQLLALHKNWNNLYEEFVDGTDWLVVEKLDLLIGPHFEKEKMREVVRQRIFQGKHTTISLGAQPNPKTEDELDLLKEVQSWGNFPLQQFS